VPFVIFVARLFARVLMTEERFRSKIDWWLAAVVAVPFVRLLWIIGNGIADGRTPRVGDHLAQGQEGLRRRHRAAWGAWAF